MPSDKRCYAYPIFSCGDVGYVLFMCVDREMLRILLAAFLNMASASNRLVMTKIERCMLLCVALEKLPTFSADGVGTLMERSLHFLRVSFRT